ncbi:hypothetical protein ISF9_051 [Microbacterium phage vB_MoxS-ISF9]|uniref:Uncharacterized protein n=1 Tax=Microbacterium phage vB_MoxS-ISF9 TaxID=1458670 RepID=W8PF82_9CAUD|nr:hypothetical protein ISF9_051 [Microbacterium phage vB_MoxS-ISF9]AHL18521.1 hypothetical protein ISF9_051 [Microbacterium phage vB_MoxS-ISF9]
MSINNYKEKRAALESLIEDAAEAEKYREKDYGHNPFEGHEMFGNNGVRSLVRLLERTDAIHVLARMVKKAKEARA